MIQEIMSKAERPVSFAQRDSDDESDKAAEERSPTPGIGRFFLYDANANLDFFFTMDRDKSVDQVDVLRWQLESRSFKVEVDYETRSESEGESPTWPCEQFVEAADVVVVFLNSDSTLNCKNVVKSIEKGFELKKKFVLVHETTRHGAKFNVTILLILAAPKTMLRTTKSKMSSMTPSIEFKRRKAFAMVTE